MALTRLLWDQPSFAQGPSDRNPTAYAPGELGVLHHRTEFLQTHPLEDYQRRLSDNVRGTIEEETTAGLTVTACAARFLEVVLDGLGNREMDDEADIGFVDAVRGGGGRERRKDGGG